MSILHVISIALVVFAVFLAELCGTWNPKTLKGDDVRMFLILWVMCPSVVIALILFGLGWFIK